MWKSKNISSVSLQKGLVYSLEKDKVKFVFINKIR